MRGNYLLECGHSGAGIVELQDADGWRIALRRGRGFESRGIACENQ
jgi:hypothetical protein